LTLKTGCDNGLACPLHHPTTYSHQTRGHGFPPGAVLSRLGAVGGGALLGDAKPPGLGHLWRCRLLGYLCHRVLHGAYFFYQDTFTLCWNHYGVYACIPGRATISGSDVTNPSTRVYAVGTHGFLQPRPILSGSECCHPRVPNAGRAYLFSGSP
jgi:hypothetical protein